MDLTFHVAAKGAATRLPSAFFGRCGEHEIGFTTASMIVDGQPIFGISGELHYSRLSPAQRRETLAKMRAGGINVVSTYSFWNHHEEVEGEFDFTGQRDLRAFLTDAQQVGLYVILRVGPFCHGEVRNGGLPDWLYGMPFPVRDLNDGFMAYVKRFFSRLAEQAQGFLYRDGGCIIGIQLENEFMHSSAMWEHTRATTREYANSGEGEDAYLLKLRDMLREVGLDAPFYTCTAWGGAATPCHDALPLWGGYPYAPWLVDDAHPVHPATEEFLYRDCRDPDGARYHSYDPCYDPRTMPFACAEMGPGMQAAYNHRFQCDPRAADALANVKTGSGCTFVGYYMFAGGTNPTGKVFPFLHEEWCPKLSYDYQAPIGEYGQLREAYRRLRVLHMTLANHQTLLCPMEPFLPDTVAVDPHDTLTPRCAVRSNGRQGFLFMNAFQDHVEMRSINNARITIHTQNGAVTFPRIDLAAGESCVLPFLLIDDGAYCATFQPLREVGNVLYAMRPDGMTSVLRLPDGEEITFGDSRIERKTVRMGNRELNIVLLSRDAANSLAFCGDEAYLCEDGTLWSDGEALVAEGNAPRVTHLTSAGESLIDLPTPEPTPSVAAAALRGHRWAITLPAFSPTNKTADLLLRIRYCGDVAQLFTLKGRLVADSFENGTPWELGLNELLSRTGGERELTLVIVPRKEGTTVSRSAMAAITESVGREVAELHAIDVLPWQKLPVK